MYPSSQVPRSSSIENLSGINNDNDQNINEPSSPSFPTAKYQDTALPEREPHTLMFEDSERGILIVLKIWIKKKENLEQNLRKEIAQLKELLLQQQNMHNQSALVAQIETLRSRAEVLDRELIETKCAKQIAQNEINRLNGEINKLKEKKNKYKSELNETTRTYTTEIEKIQRKSQKKISKLETEKDFKVRNRKKSVATRTYQA